MPQNRPAAQAKTNAGRLTSYIYSHRFATIFSTLVSSDTMNSNRPTHAQTIFSRLAVKLTRRPQPPLARKQKREVGFECEPLESFQASGVHRHPGCDEGYRVHWHP